MRRAERSLKEVIETMAHIADPIRNSVAALLVCVAILALCAMQFGDRSGLNNMSFAQVQAFVSDLGKAQRLARQGNIELLGGQLVPGQAVRLRGEFTDANCYLGYHTHGYDHAFCAKVCVAAGSSLVFISDQQGKVYVVLTGKNGIRFPENVLDQIGVPGVVVTGRLVESDGVQALAVDRVGR
jgi:hypothetical protein